MPYSNVRQDSLRAQIKGGEARAMTGTGRQWLASAESNRLYSYEFNEHTNTLEQPTIYEFDPEGVHSTIMTSGSSGQWTSTNRVAFNDAEVLRFQGMQIERQLAAQIDVAIEPVTIFKPTIDKPSQLSATGLNNYLVAARRRGVEVSDSDGSAAAKVCGAFQRDRNGIYRYTARALLRQKRHNRRSLCGRWSKYRLLGGRRRAATTWKSGITAPGGCAGAANHFRGCRELSAFSSSNLAAN